MKRQTLLLLMVLLISLGIGQVYSQDSSWTVKENMHVGRNLLSTTAVNGVLYAIGGGVSSTTSTSIVEAYDTTTGKWTYKEKLPRPLCGSAACQLAERIYVIGGSDGGVFGTADSSIYIYSPVTNLWQQKYFPKPIEFATACVRNGRIYVIGGTTTGFDTAYNSVYEYNLFNDMWSKKADMPTARFCHSATVIDEKIYVIGGTQNSSLTALDKVEVYDPSTDSWSTMNPMPVGRCLHAASAVKGKIYIFGGGTGHAEENYINVDEYDPDSDTWKTISTIPTFRWGLQACTIGEKIYTVGGADSLNQASSVLEVFNPPSNPTGVNEHGNFNMPKEFNLFQNYPNPFNPTTKIEYSIPVVNENFSFTTKVVLKVYSVLGREVATLVNEYKPAGKYEIEFNASSLPSGVYLYKLKTGNYSSVKKMLLLK